MTAVWATYRLYWDWDGDGDFSEPSEELTSYRIDTSIQYGCSGSPITSKDMAGQLVVQLDNSTGIFSKGNSGVGGIYYGYMVPASWSNSRCRLVPESKRLYLRATLKTSPLIRLPKR